MYLLSSSVRVLMPQWIGRDLKVVTFCLNSKRMLSFIRSVSSSGDNSSSSLPKRTQLGYDPSDELLGVDLKPRNNKTTDSREPRSWFGPNGQYIRELPCPSCRGRGYTPCSECGIERSRLDCPLCNGKGIMKCHQCSGDCVIWEESIDERPWETARSISPLKVKEDDEVDSMDIKLDVKPKSKRKYQSPSPEVGLKISRSLKSLNAKTGLFTKRMMIIHRNPTLQAQRVAAIKKAKGTPAARQRASVALKAFFSDPENRRKRSLSMKGVKFYCKCCGREGHRRHYCPELVASADRRFTCRVCGEKGHNRRTCPKLRFCGSKQMVMKQRQCSICHESGHNRRTCPTFARVDQAKKTAEEEVHISPGKGHGFGSRGKKGKSAKTYPIRGSVRSRENINSTRE